jgi:hypothetical protein
MRDTERFLTIVCLGGSIIAGALHLTPWLLAPPLSFIGLLVAEDRAVHQRIGAGNWPSVGYARFLFGTNIYRAVRITLAGAGLFAAASGISSLLGR